MIIRSMRFNKEHFKLFHINSNKDKEHFKFQYQVRFKKLFTLIRSYKELINLDLIPASIQLLQEEILKELHNVENSIAL